MILRRILVVTFTLLMFLAVTIGLTSLNHPIILKWLTASAMHFGKPIPAIVYANGHENDNIKVFYTDEADTYLLSFTPYDSAKTSTFVKINIDEKEISKAVGTSEVDFDFICGHLFQSKDGVNFSPIQSGANGAAFTPRLSNADEQIKFNLPPGEFKFDSIRIKLH